MFFNIKSHLCAEMDVAELLIIERLKNGEEKAYKYLYDHHYVLLCKFANELLHDPFLAETIVGDLIFHLWEIREHIEINTSIRSYLMRSVRNRCYNHLQKEQERREISLSKLEEDNLDRYTHDDGHPLGLLLEHELENEISRSIASLGDECRRVFKMSRFEHKKNDEIATELGISVNTVKYHIKNALACLHKDLGKYLIGLLLFLKSFL